MKLSQPLRTTKLKPILVFKTAVIKLKLAIHVHTLVINAKFFTGLPVWLCLYIPLCERLHHPVNLLGLPGKPETPQKLPGNI